MRSIPIASALIASLVLFSLPAHAEFEVKRLKCDELQNLVYTNRTSATQTVSVQISRDGCSPRGESGGYVMAADGTPNFEIDRSGRTGSVYQAEVASDGEVNIQFIGAFGVRKRGTYDVRVAID